MYCNVRYETDLAAGSPPETFWNHYLSYEDDYIITETGIAFLNMQQNTPPYYFQDAQPSLFSLSAVSWQTMHGHIEMIRVGSMLVTCCINEFTLFCHSCLSGVLI